VWFTFLIATFIPLIPSGSFFTTHVVVLFWFNFALMLPKEDSISKKIITIDFNYNLILIMLNEKIFE